MAAQSMRLTLREDMSLQAQLGPQGAHPGSVPRQCTPPSTLLDTLKDQRQHSPGACRSTAMHPNQHFLFARQIQATTLSLARV